MKHLKILKSISEQQYGIVCRRQLIEHECSTSAIGRMVNNGLLERLGYGVYRTFAMQDSWHQKAAISVFSYGTSSFLSHESVLVYFGLLGDRTNKWSAKTSNYLLRPIHVLATDIDQHQDGSILHQTISIASKELNKPKIGIPYVSLERAFVDCTKKLTIPELDFALERAFFKRLTMPEKILDALDRAPNGRGRLKRRLKQTVQPYLGSNHFSRPTESKLEKRVQRAIEKFTCSECVPQFEVNIQGKKFRIDFALPSKSIAVEVDGFVFHRNRTRFDSDRVRQNLLTAAGWTVVRITASFTDHQIGEALQPLTDF